MSSSGPGHEERPAVCGVLVHLSPWAPRLIGGGMGDVDGAGSRCRDGVGQEAWVETVGSQLVDHGTEEPCGIA